MAQLAAKLGSVRPTAGPALFVCRHRVFGVGMFDAATVLAGDRLVAEAGAGPGECDVLVGTVSACHGAVSLLHLGGHPAASPPGERPGTPVRSIFGQPNRGR
jgi:hypothetical protein